MKITHICLANFYIDNYTYQENMLPKYHKLLGHDVEIIASTRSFDANGEGCYIEARSYVNENGIQVTRLPFNHNLPTKIGKFLRMYDGFRETLSQSKPDIIFVHGCQFVDIGIVIEYAKKHDAVIYVDNHADFSNSARNWLSKNILHKILWKSCAQAIEPYTRRFYGVLPARVDFLQNIYDIPAEKTELLIMGGDDELVENVTNTENRTMLREKYGFSEDDFVIITGGKIDHAKRQMITLLQVMSENLMENVKLIVYGSIVEDMQSEVLKYCDGKNIVYAGWLDKEQIARHLAAAELAVYPGRHSVLWEETACLGIPMLVKEWAGTTHVNVNGNTRFLTQDTYEELKEKVFAIVENKKEYDRMKLLALACKNAFSYKEIAKRSIQDAQ